MGARGTLAEALPSKLSHLQHMQSNFKLTRMALRKTIEPSTTPLSLRRTTKAYGISHEYDEPGDMKTTHAFVGDV